MANKLGLLVLVFLAGLLAACKQVEVVETVVLITETAVSPTIPSPTTTYTPTPSPTQTAVLTKPPTATATATTIPTLTPLPTFAPEELETAVADLLANPMNCDVPCWWGAILGETTFFEVLQFIQLYQFNDYVRYLEQMPDDSFELGIKPSENAGPYGFRVWYGFNNNILTFLSSGHAPSIFKMLERYGQPDDVWLATGITPDPMVVRLYLVYLQEGMVIGYVVEQTSERSDLIKGCFSNGESGHLRLRVPNTATSYKDFYTIIEEDRRYLSLEEATNLTVAEFMQQFSDPNQPQCLETPTELWE